MKRENKYKVGVGCEGVAVGGAVVKREELLWTDVLR